MLLRSVELTRFRCFKTALLEPGDETTFIFGKNGSGKTSLIEAIYYLAHGRSFRTAQVEELSWERNGSFALLAHTITDQHVPLTIASQWTANERVALQIGGQRARGFIDAAAVLPVRVVDSDVHLIVEGAPANRRRFLDWGVFHVEHSFVSVWRRYQRALRQRNVALRRQLSSKEILIWDAELAETGERITRFRADYVEELSRHLQPLALALLNTAVTLKLDQGWPADLSLTAAFDRSWGNDQRRCTTTVGPHRADLRIEISGRAVAPQVSRGQQKLLASAMTLSQLSYAAATGATRGCLLVDDPHAELDVDNFERLLATIEAIPAQRIITGTEEMPRNSANGARMFHVKPGKIERVL